MQDADLFMELAAIAGVFVGFGALIAVRSGGASDVFEVAYMRGVVSFGLLTIVAALAPVTLARYPLTDPDVWVLSSILVASGIVVSTAVNARTPEWRAESRTSAELGIPRWVLPVGVVFLGVVVLAVALSPIVILLGLAPDLEGALYFTLVLLILLWDAWLLLQMVFRGRQPASG